MSLVMSLPLVAFSLPQLPLHLIAAQGIERLLSHVMDVLDLSSSHDLSRLLLCHAGLSTTVAISPRATSYNLPLALYGLVVCRFVLL